MEASNSQTRTQESHDRHDLKTESERARDKKERETDITGRYNNTGN